MSSTRRTFDYLPAPGSGGDMSAPPLLFKDVNMAFLPLRADILALRRFCDDYLNIMPAEIACFQPSGPFVLLGIINYGSMSSEILNTGWVAQNEVVFSIPLDCFRQEDGRLCWQEQATTSPFIFVDSASSQVTGRETFGWPKEHVWLSREESSTRWGPDELRRLVTLRSRPLEGGAEAWQHGGRRFLEIACRPPAGVSLFPPDPASALNPWRAWAQAIESSLRIAGDGMTALLRPPGSGYPPMEPQAWLDMAFAQLRQLALPGAAMGSSVINFKQFPRAEHPRSWAPPNAAYQALIRSRMALAQFRRGGLLGENTILLGNPSGGYRVRLSRKAGGGILEALGLETAAEERWGDEGAAVLEPFFPFWMDLDLRYERSETVCWRRPDWGPDGNPDLSWSDESGEQPKRVPAKDHDRCAYNLSRRDPIEELTGRLSFPGSTLRVFPLFAQVQLQGDEDLFCRSALGDGRCYRRWGDFVYLIAANSEQVADRDTGEISRWAHRKLAFAVPVQRRDPASCGLSWDDKESRILEWGLVEPIVFVDSDLEAIRSREINGIPAARATLESPPSVWMDEFQQEGAHSSRLVLDTELPSAVGPGQKVERRRLIEIFRGRRPTAGRPGVDTQELEEDATSGFSMMQSPELSFVAILMLSGLESEDDAKTLKAHDLLGMAAAIHGMSEQLLGGTALGNANKKMLKRVQRAEREGLMVNQYSLKQFRDAENPSAACYRSRVRQRIRLVPAQRPGQPEAGPRGLIEEFKEGTEEGAASEPLWLALHSYPVQAITRQLGLEPTWTDDSGDRIVNYFRPMKWSFWVKGTLDFEQADEGDHWESPPAEGPADPELEKLLNSEHNILDPLQVVKMLLDAKSAVSPLSMRRKISGIGTLEAFSIKDTLSEIEIKLRESGSMQMEVKGKSKRHSLSGKWIAIHSVVALVIEKIGDHETVATVGIFVDGGAIAIAGPDKMEMTFDPE